jgi:glycosyltransferase involved in cell wall biosynthesis
VRVDFILRCDALTKHGGDVVQADRYVDHLRALGVDVQVQTWHPGLQVRENSLVHFFNVDREYEFLDVARECQRRGIPYFVSTIHHSHRHLRALRRAERAGIARRALSYLPERARELAVHVHRMTRLNDVSRSAQMRHLGRSVAAYLSGTSRVTSALLGADEVFTLNASEEEALKSDFAYSGHCVRTPNGAPALKAPRKDWDDRAERIVVVGRIEPRKRQLDLLRAADKLGVGLTFVGACTTSAADYGNTFQTAIDASAHSQWLGPITHDEVVELMASSRVVLNFSWVEVQSLVDIEAARAGCFVVASEGGTSPSDLPGTVHVAPASDPTQAVDLASRFCRAARGPASRPYDASWETTARTLEAEYRRSHTRAIVGDALSS